MDDNSNPLCDRCFDSKGEYLPKSPYTNDYILSINKKVCYPKIANLKAATDNKVAKLSA